MPIIQSDAPSESTAMMEMTLIDPFVFCAWCARCTISRMAPGYLTNYQALVAEEIQNYLTLRAHLYYYMEQPLLITYRHAHYLITIASSKAHHDNATVFQHPQRLK